MALLYQHIRLDNNSVFYVGIGKAKARAYTKHNRNSHWNRVVNKHGYRVEIILENLSWDQAKEEEVKLIKKLGRVCDGSGILVNQTTGGDGVSGYKHTEEWKQQNSLRNRGRKLTEKHIDSIRKYMTNRIVSYETRAKISNTLKNKYPPKIHKIKKIISNCKWLNKDGLNIRIEKDKIEQYLKNGWIKGRYILKQTKDKMAKKGSIWYNNGSTEKMITNENRVECGWTKGRLYGRGKRKFQVNN